MLQMAILVQVPRVKAFLDVYYQIDNAFEFLKQDLTKMYIEAKDNVRFLSTLERHFKNVTHGANFQVRFSCARSVAM